MKKAILFIASVVLLITGCAKENFSNTDRNEGVVSFTVALPDAGTRAVTHNDGNAAKINHWIMEVIDEDGTVYSRQEKDGEVGSKTQTFDVSLVKSQTYTVLFWADSVDVNHSGAYNTESLRSVTVKDASGYVANKDSRDAFSAVVPDFQSTEAASSKNVTLKRPFAQMNVVFTDLAKLYSVLSSQTEYDKFAPVNFKVTAKIPTSFNVETQTSGSPAAVALVNTSAKNYCNNYAAHTGADILFMDYIFATAESKDIVDIDFEFYSRNNKIAYSFTSVPFQRNYRTNILGNFMSSDAKWTVQLDYQWANDQIDYNVVNDINSANTLIANEIASGKTEINVKFDDQPDDAGVPGPASGNAIVTTGLPSGTVLNIIVEAETKSLYIGDYASQNDPTLVTTGTNAAVVNVNVPAGGSIKTLVINAPSKTVNLNGFEMTSGTIENVEATTSASTLIISEGQDIGSLTLRQGAVKIFGNVGTVVVPQDHGTIYVRDCEGLSASVYNVLKPYVDVNNGYAGVQDGDKWNVVKGAAPYVAKVGDENFYTFAAAVAAVQEKETITILASCETGGEYTMTDALALDASGSILDLNGQTLTITNNFSFFVAADSVVVRNGSIAAGPNPNKACGYNSYSICIGAQAQDATVKGVKLQNLSITGGIDFGGSVGDSEYEGSGEGIVENCNVTSGDFATVYAQGNTSSVVILSGSFTQTPKSLENTGIVVNEEGCSVIIKGGSYNSDPSAWVHEDCKVTHDSGIWTVTPKDPVAKIGTKTYTTLEKALAAAVANDEIILLADYTLTAQTTLGKNLSFDLNDKTISFNVSGTRALVLNDNAEISFKNGGLAITDPNSLGLFEVSGCKSLTLTSVDMTGNTSDANGKSGFIFQGNEGACAVTLTDCSGTTNYRIYRGQGSNSTLTVTNGTYNCAGYNVAFQDAGTASYSGVSITVSGAGTSDYQSGIYVNGKTAEINACTIDCPDSRKGAITVCYEGTATVNGGSYSGLIAVDVLYSGGVVTINDGTFTSSGGNDSYSLYADSRQSGEKYVGTDKTANIIVNGGTVTGDIGIQHKAKVYVHAGTVNNDAALTGEGNPIIADGGTFAFDPSAYVVSGYIAQAQGTTPETWKVVEDPFAGKVAKIGDVGYSTLDAAFSSVKANETITLLDDVLLGSSYSYDSPIAISKSGVVLDLNGKTITSTKSSSLQVKGTSGAGVSDVKIKNGHLNVVDGDVSKARYAFCSEYATNLRLESVQMNGGANISTNSTAEFDDCTIKLNLNESNFYAIYVQGNADITINSGTYDADCPANGACINLNPGSDATIKGGTFKGNPVSPKNASQSKYYLSGGSFEFRTTAYWPKGNTPDWIVIQDGYTCTSWEDKVDGATTQFRVLAKND